MYFRYFLKDTIAFKNICNDHKQVILSILKSNCRD